MGTPKALLPWGDRPLALAHAEAARAAGCARVCVVVREAVARVLPPAPEGVRWCVSREDPALGPAGSIRAALREEISADRIALSPVDLDPEAWRCLPMLSNALGDKGIAAKPAYGSRRGHPVLVRAEALAPYRLGEAPPLRALLAALGPRVIVVPVDLPAVLGDLDTPEDLRVGKDPA